MCQEDQDAQDDLSRELLRRYRGNDRLAFRRLYDLHAEDVRAVVRSTLWATDRDPRIDDVCQKVWLAVIKGASFKGGARFRSWLFSIAKNRSVSELRNEARHEAFKEDFAALKRAEGAFVPAPSYEDLDGPELRRDVEQSLAAIPPEQREAIELKHMDDLTHEEVAQKQDVPERTARKRIELGFEKLRRTLKRYGPDPITGPDTATDGA